MITKEERTLHLNFTNEAGKTVSYTFKNPKMDLKQADVEADCKKLVDLEVFTTEGGKITGLKEAKIITRTVESLG